MAFHGVMKGRNDLSVAKLLSTIALAGYIFEEMENLGPGRVKGQGTKFCI